LLSDAFMQNICQFKRATQAGFWLLHVKTNSLVIE
jgi:hypothetical protein